MEIEKNLKLTLLFDFYGNLLTDKQQDIFERYYYEDISLGEIATYYNISRQAVRDCLQKSEKLLIMYEDKLGGVERYKKVIEWAKNSGGKLSKKDVDSLLKIWEV